jgi:protein-S-isoprenylcysteine O-methyltransferase Ste14
MYNWINLIILVISTALMAFYYIRSVGPAALEKKIGESAYVKCGRYRVIIPISQFFPWKYWISLIISFVILIPCVYIMLKGVKDAGREALFPDKKHTLYKGIYEKIRHPQAIGEVFLWWAAALLLNSPFLFLYSIVWFPLFYWFCRAEEKDLIKRYGKSYTDYRERVGMFFPRRK